MKNSIFIEGNRHNYLMKMALKLEDEGIPKCAATDKIVEFAKANGDTEDREYITELVYHQGLTQVYILERDYKDGEVTPFCLVNGPAGASFSYLRQLFAEAHPDKAKVEDVDNIKVSTNDFVDWLCEECSDEWYEVDFRYAYLPEIGTYPYMRED